MDGEVRRGGGRAVGAGEYRRLISAAEAGAAASGEAGTYHLAACEMMLAFAERNPGLPENDYRQLLNLGIAYGLEGLRTDRPMVAYHCISKLGEYSKDPRTESWLRELVSVDPHWFRGYLLLADHALNAGRLDEAKAHAQTASRLAPFHQEPSLLWDRIQSADGR